MNQDPTLIPVGALTLVAMLVLAAAVARLVLARQQAARRQVERPGPENAPPAMREKDTARRWAAINLDALHEINREEVRRLLADVEAAGADSLRPAERVFLDNLSGA
jgi:hypothetical protein